MCAKDWCKELGIGYEYAFRRAKKQGIGLDEAIFGKGK